MSFNFKSDDTLLINRDEKSYRLTVSVAKDIVNPEGVLIPPTIDNIIDGQGFPVLSDEIDRVDSIAEGVKLTLKSDLNLDLIVSYPEPIELSEPYVPITTGVESVSVTGNEYTFRFLPVNYDFSFFKATDKVYVDTDRSINGEITAINTSEATITVTSTNPAWGTIIGRRIEIDTDQTDPLTASGELEPPTLENGKVKCVVKNVTGTWVDQYNNRRTKTKFSTSLPRGGFEVDARGFTFKASPFDMRDFNDPSRPNRILTLQKVTWRINGREYIGTVTGGGRPETFDAPADALYNSRDLTNSITVTYFSGNYRETSERYLFKSDLNPKTTTTTIDLLNRIEGYQDDTTSLGL